MQVAGNVKDSHFFNALSVPLVFDFYASCRCLDGQSTFSTRYDEPFLENCRDRTNGSVSTHR